MSIWLLSALFGADAAVYTLGGVSFWPERERLEFYLGIGAEDPVKSLDLLVYPCAWEEGSFYLGLGAKAAVGRNLGWFRADLGLETSAFLGFLEAGGLRGFVAAAPFVSLGISPSESRIGLRLRAGRRWPGGLGGSVEMPLPLMRFLGEGS